MPKPKSSKVLRIFENKFTEELPERPIEIIDEPLYHSQANQRVPVVLYNERYYDKKTDVVERVNRSGYQNNSKDMNNIVRILRKN